MVIETGYWNYYMSFRLADNKKLIHNIKTRDYFEGVIGVALNGDILKNSSIDEYFEERKNVMLPLIERKFSEAWDETIEQQLYVENKIPEYYFDFINIDGQYIDILESNFLECIDEIHEINKVFNSMVQETHRGSWQCMALMPLKVELKPFNYEYCPVYIYLFENGYGVIKVSIKISECDVACFSSYPMKTWFNDVKAWEPLMNMGGRKEFKIYTSASDNQDITIISYILERYIYRLFDENLLDERIFSCFETFSIGGTKPTQLWEINKMGSDTEKRDVYRFANPENIMSQMSPEIWNGFWNDFHMYFNGFHLLKGNNCRLIMSIEPDILKEQFGRKEIGDFGSYLNISIQRSFDMFLVIALCQKDDELYLYRVSQLNIHNIDKQMAKYNQNQNYFENFMDIAPHNARLFYSVIREINDNSFVDTNVRTERLKQIESYQKNLFIEKRSLLFESVALIASTLFGLPIICDTLTILRRAFLPAGDLISGEFTPKLAIVVWFGIIVLMSIYLWKTYKQYKARKL